MLSFINQIGMFGWPLTIIALATIAIFIKSMIAAFRGDTAAIELTKLKFMGKLGLSVGAFSTLLGIFQGLQIFSQISGAQAATGFSRALLAVMFGLVSYILASIFHQILHCKSSKLLSATES